MARITSTRTTWKARSPTCNACRTICVIESTTARPLRELRNGFASAWKRSGNCARPKIGEVPVRPPVLSQSCFVLFQNAAIHHHEDSRPARLLGGLLVNHIFLHPDRWDFQLNRLIHNFLNKLRPPKDVHNVDFIRHVEQRSISLLAQTGIDLWIHRNDPVSMALHVGGDAVAGTQRIAGETDYGDIFGALE